MDISAKPQAAEASATLAGMPLAVVSLLGVSFVLSTLLCFAVLRVARRFELYDRSGTQAHKAHGRSVPNLGGVAIFWSIALPLAAAMVAVWVVPAETWRGISPAVATHLDGLRRTTAIGGGVLCAMSLLHLLGLIDDRRPIGPYFKLGFQAVVALGLVLLCDIRVLHALDSLGPWGGAVSVTVSVVWFVVIVNAMNFLDNMDGLSAGVGATAATLYLAATLIGGQWFVAGLAALLVGALMGFLLFNFPPARLFMGDGGSLVLGMMLAVISMRTTYYESPLPGLEAAVSPGLEPHRWYGVLMPLMVLAIPLYDFTSVTIIRLLQGKSPFRGDHNHFSHRLVRKGLSKRRAVVLIWMCTLATGFGGVMLGSLSAWQAALAAGQTLAILAVLAVMERGTPTVAR